ncbi:UNVERIFIED_ORG: heme oxygenase [Arthrobacter sp. UYCu721]
MVFRPLLRVKKNMTAPLSVLLKQSTSAAHEEAESSPFMGDLLEGRLDATVVAALTTQLYTVYGAMESVARSEYGSDPLLAGFLDPALERTAALEADMVFHYGAGWRARLADGRIVTVPATTAYATLIREHHSAEFMLANHYVRLLGDLSGGQIIHRLVQRHYGIPDDGLNCFIFPASGK